MMLSRIGGCWNVSARHIPLIYKTMYIMYRVQGLIDCLSINSERGLQQKKKENKKRRRRKDGIISYSELSGMF